MLHIWILALLFILNKIFPDFIKALRHFHDATFDFKQLQESDFLRILPCKDSQGSLSSIFARFGWENAEIGEVIYWRPVNGMAELESQLGLIKLYNIRRKNSTPFSSVLLKTLCWIGHLHRICNLFKRVIRPQTSFFSTSTSPTNFPLWANISANTLAMQCCMII